MFLICSFKVAVLGIVACILKENIFALLIVSISVTESGNKPRDEQREWR